MSLRTKSFLKNLYPLTSHWPSLFQQRLWQMSIKIAGLKNENGRAEEILSGTYYIMPELETISRASWRISSIRIAHSIFQHTSNELWLFIEKKYFNFRESFRAEIKIAVFLLFTGDATHERAAAQLGIGSSSASATASSVSKAIAQRYCHMISFCFEARNHHHNERSAGYQRPSVMHWRYWRKAHEIDCVLLKISSTGIGVTKDTYALYSLLLSEQI